MISESRVDRLEVRDLLGLVIGQPEQIVALPASRLDLAVRLARRARLLGRLAVKLRNTGVIDKLPAIVVDQLQSAVTMAGSRSRLAMWELNRIAWAMRPHQEIPLVLMKGCAYLVLDLPNAAGRSFADVDLLTHESSINTVECVLNKRGWKTAELTPYDQRYYRKWTHELPPLVHEQREVEIDLHHNMLPRTARIFPPAARLLESSRPAGDQGYRVLCDEDIVLHAIVHLCFDSDFIDGLRDLVDIADLVEHFAATNSGFWMRLLDRAEELGVMRPTFYGLILAERLIDLALPGIVSARLYRWSPNQPTRWLMTTLVTRVLYPVHPDRHSRRTEFYRFLLVVRFHWIRMSPLVLTRHLSHKLLTGMSRRLGRNSAAH